jgi:hypothetical protein
MRLPIALGSYKRDAGFLPELRLRNLFPEKTPADDEGVVLLPRPGLKSSYTVDGNVKALWTDPGMFNGDTIALAGAKLFRGSVNRGTLSSAAALDARFAGIPGELVFCNSGVLYRFDGASLSNPSFPDGAAVAAVTVLDNYFFAVRKGTRKFYWSAVADGVTWPALNFASAESHPGNLIDIIAINDHLALIGQESIEFWQANPTGDQALPFVRIDGLTYSKGALNTGAACYVDNTLVWVGNDGIVYRRGAVPQRISDHGIEEQITQAGTATLFSFAWAGHTFLVLRLPQATYFYDFETQNWVEASTISFTGWRAQCGCFNGINPVFGDSAGHVMSLDDTAVADVDAAIERRFTALLPNQMVVDNLWLEAQGGIGSEPTGDPILVELSISRDGSQTYSAFYPSDLGKRGEYRKRAAWRRLGRYDMGAAFDFRTTDPAPFTIQSIRVNEPLAGRGV